MKTNQSMPPLLAVLSNRAKWLWEFARLRNYSFETNEQRNQFLYIYFLTVKQAFDNNGLAKALTDKRNRRFAKSLTSHELNKKMNVWDLPENNRIFKNETIIEMLGITDKEVEVLQIGKNKKEKEERAKRKAAKRERNTEILLLSAKGWTQKSIAAHLDIPEMLQNISTIVIDEISMARVDIFTKIMQIIKFAESRGQSIRLIALGDFAQLRPVVTIADIEILKMLYPDIKGYYAFHSPLWEDAHFEKIILHNVKRQSDTEFIKHLEGIKYGRLSDLEWVMKNASPFMSAKPVYIGSS